ncbi:unnamed protein product [Toxocara canis]|uniref:Secreted protein n=1 Tax=Toxocara canis TaxID=6265 RepID=A0A183UV94_TOXCA|nr:unnamed protein product [Toxocara canis]
MRWTLELSVLVWLVASCGGDGLCSVTTSSEDTCSSSSSSSYTPAREAAGIYRGLSSAERIAASCSPPPSLIACLSTQAFS